jgi:hypothetical protein
LIHLFGYVNKKSKRRRVTDRRDKRERERERGERVREMKKKD